LHKLKLQGWHKLTPQLPQLRAVKGAVTIAADTTTAPPTIAPAATKGAASALPKQHCASALIGATKTSKASARDAITKVDLAFMFCPP